jgi:lipopolysaccharide/colanic/teichoic acid biosynthesis glycosyltransferase
VTGLLLAIALAVVVALIVAEIKGGAVVLAQRIAAAAAHRAPHHGDRLQEEWLADIEQLRDRPLTALLYATRAYRSAGGRWADLTERPELPPKAQLAKRALDLVVVSAVLFVISPLILLLAIAVRYDSPGPAMFRQRARGRRGKSFHLLRFRTMRLGAPKKSAPTHLGFVLRRAALDALPLFFNVLRGDMSLVGPRPLPEHLADKIGEMVPDRPDLTPGLIPIAYLIEHRGGSFLEQLDEERRYVEGWSLWRDLKILVLCVPIAFSKPKRERE